ncbi:MAG: dihydroorotase [Patescibacteria group bacterium]
MIFDLIIRKAKIVTPTGVIEGDIGVHKGIISKIGGTIPQKAPVEKDGTGLFALPGTIDMHVHFRDPGNPEKEDFGTGSAAAAAGGVTTIIDMPNTTPSTTTCQALEEKRAAAALKSHVNYGFFFGLTHDNLHEIKNAKNIAGVKVFLAQSTGGLMVHDSATIEKLFELGKFTIFHAEDERIISEHQKKYKGSVDPSIHSLIRSSGAAFEAVKLVLHLAKKHNARVHITHVSSQEEVKELRKFHGPLVSADCTPHHLFLTQSAYHDRGNYVKMNPPLRTNEDRQALWKGLKDGIIQAVASDHAPHTKTEKEKSYELAPAGVPGVETLLPLLLDSVNHGEISLREVARFTSQNPAALLGIQKKGKIEAGFDADLVLVDMEKEMEVGKHGFFTKCGWSPFSGWKLKGWPIMTFVGGQIVYENNAVHKNIRGKEVYFSS